MTAIVWTNPALTRAGGRAGHGQQPPPRPPDPWAGDIPSADICPVDQLSFWRIVNVPYQTWLAALQRWQLTAPNSELRLGRSLLRGPIEHDRHFGTCQIEARLARGPLRPPLRMRLDIDYWSRTATALALIPCQRIRPTAAYFQAGHYLLTSLTRALPQPAAAQPHPGRQGQDIWRHLQPAATPAHEQATMNRFRRTPAGRVVPPGTSQPPATQRKPHPPHPASGPGRDTFARRFIQDVAAAATAAAGQNWYPVRHCRGAPPDPRA